MKIKVEIGKRKKKVNQHQTRGQNTTRVAVKERRAPYAIDHQKSSNALSRSDRMPHTLTLSMYASINFFLIIFIFIKLQNCL